MCVFYSGGPAGRVPDGEEECRYGPSGVYGRALLDAPGLMVSKFSAAFTWLLTTGVTVAAFIVVPNGSTGTRAIFAVIGLVVGTFFAVLLVAAWGTTPWAQRHHWRTHCEPVRGGNPDDTFFIILTSRHWHRILNLRCILVGPDHVTSVGTEHSSTHDEFMRPAETRILACPANFSEIADPNGSAPHGPYTIEWQTDVEDGTEPITIAKDRYVYRGLRGSSDD